MTRGRAMETGDDERREMETTERADVRGARFRRRRAREREGKKKARAFVTPRVYASTHRLESRSGALFFPCSR